MNKKSSVTPILGIVVIAVAVVIAISVGKGKGGLTGGEAAAKTEKIYVAMGGGKERFVQDEEVKRIMAEKYQIEIVPTAWSNGKLIDRDVKLVTDEGKPYDAVFFSDQRFYDYFKAQNIAKNLQGSIALNTPVVIYSWDSIADALAARGVVEERNGTYFINDMGALLGMIQDGTKWSDLGLTHVFGTINIGSTDPVTSSPGATYYGLLMSIMNGGPINEKNVDKVLPTIKDFYEYSGFMNNTPADLFDLYLRTGMGAKPMIVDYEKSILEFAVANPEGYDQVKSKVRILYPEPTIWNSHCLLTLTEKGNKYLEALNDPDIRRIAWEQYGFRTGLTGGDNVTEMPVQGLADELTSVVPGLKKEVYDVMIEALKEN